MTGLDGTSQKRKSKASAYDLNTFVGWLYPTAVAIGGLIFVNWYFGLHLDDLVAKELARWSAKITAPLDTVWNMLRIVFS